MEKSDDNNLAIIEKFYSSFARLDSEGMVSCYHPEIEFEDPAFGKLKGNHAGNMWRMLCSSQKGKEFFVKASGFSADHSTGKAEWTADYTFSKTGRKVHNQIQAEFQFQEGLIRRHVDSFDLHRWASQALGWKGRLLGGTTFFRKKLQASTNAMLRKYEEHHPSK